MGVSKWRAEGLLLPHLPVLTSNHYTQKVSQENDFSQFGEKIPYSGFISWDKAFTNFAFLW